MTQFDPTWAGTDEVGRGCLAGPVVVAAVAWRSGKPPAWSSELRDSKKLTAERRSILAQRLCRAPEVRWRLGFASVAEIDRLNILQASLQAMAACVISLGELVGVYADGNHPLPLSLPQKPIVGGDDLVPQIAAASILAKVFRDRWMACLDAQHPGYNWSKNKGYGTSEHLQALARLGPTPEHRRSFAPIKQLALAL